MTKSLKALTLSFSDLNTFFSERDLFIPRILGMRPKLTKFEAIGEGTHIIASEGSTEESRRKVDRLLSKLPEGERAESAQTIDHLAANAREMDDNGDETDMKRENLFQWTDSVTGWTIFAKPDKVGYARDEESGREVLKIADMKSGSQLRRKHLDQLFFFGLIYSLAHGYRCKILLELAYLGDKTPITRWYSPKATERSLANLRGQIQQIEQHLVDNIDKLPHDSDWHRAALALAAKAADRKRMRRPAFTRGAQTLASAAA